MGRSESDFEIFEERVGRGLHLHYFPDVVPVHRSVFGLRRDLECGVACAGCVADLIINLRLLPKKTRQPDSQCRSRRRSCFAASSVAATACHASSMAVCQVGRLLRSASGSGDSGVAGSSRATRSAAGWTGVCSIRRLGMPLAVPIPLDLDLVMRSTLLLTVKSIQL